MSKQKKLTKIDQNQNRFPRARSSHDERVALVIGNSKYLNIPALENPTKDAELMVNTLRSVGFDNVIIKLNLTRQQMMEALKEFQILSQKADWAAIYYAGHGIEVSGMNYMLPIDAQKTEEKNISTQTVNMEYLLNSVEFAKKLRLVILDACRNNPYVDQIQQASFSRGMGSLESTAIGSGLTRIEPEPGTLVVYAAKAGSFALEGEGINSPFAQALSKRIEQTPSIEVRRLFDFVRQDVYVATNKEQQPFSYGSLDANLDFFFKK